MRGNNAVFLDTSGWIALLNADDALHEQATRSLRESAAQGRLLTTTDWVLAETGNGLARFAARSRYALAVERFLNSPQAQVVHIDPDAFQRALRLYAQSADKTWGLVDCASFLIMRDAGIQDALTADRHFHQAGFHCLLDLG